VSQSPLQLQFSPAPEAEVVKTTTREAAIGKKKTRHHTLLASTGQ
ncbi:hypothetical protein LEMLEM_LOCUS26235, partial [Lemmus lemmus]